MGLANAEATHAMEPLTIGKSSRRDIRPHKLLYLGADLQSNLFESSILTFAWLDSFSFALAKRGVVSKDSGKSPSSNLGYKNRRQE